MTDKTWIKGEDRKKLEERFDTPLAAMKICDARSSLPKIPPARFFESNVVALADIKRMAEIEKAAQESGTKK